MSAVAAPDRENILPFQEIDTYVQLPYTPDHSNLVTTAITIIGEAVRRTVPEFHALSLQYFRPQRDGYDVLLGERLFQELRHHIQTVIDDSPDRRPNRLCLRIRDYVRGAGVALFTADVDLVDIADDQYRLLKHPENSRTSV